VTTTAASLRECLVDKPDAANAVIAYLTLGDPANDFTDCAQAIIDAGALTLELGVPLDAPREGEILLASHRRARAGGTDEDKALAFFSAVHQANPAVPLIAVNQWQALGDSDSLGSFVARASRAGASAVLIVGLPFGQLGRFRSACDDANIESVLSCFPDTPGRMRSMIYRQCTGCIYVARSRGSSGGEAAVSVNDLCREIRSETDVPLIVGFGITDAEAVSRVCAAGGHAAVVGSALVERVAENWTTGARFMAGLLGK